MQNTEENNVSQWHGYNTIWLGFSKFTQKKNISSLDFWKVYINYGTRDHYIKTQNRILNSEKALIGKDSNFDKSHL